MILLTLAAAMAASTADGRPLRPIGNWRSWLTARDYPLDAQIAREEGVTGFEIAIDPQGLPSACRITRSSGSRSLDDAACAALMQRVRFKPPRGRKGAGIGGTYRQSVRWRLPPAAHAAVNDPSFGTHAIVSPAGQVVSCVVSGGKTGAIVKAGESCGPFGDRAFLTYLLGRDYAKSRQVDARLIIVDDASTARRGARNDAYRLLAKAQLDIAADGGLAKCTSAIGFEALGHSLDLCTFVRADPPRFLAAPQPRKAIVLLDLSSSFN